MGNLSLLACAFEFRRYVNAPDLIVPGGPEGSVDAAFIAFAPERALWIRANWMGGRDTWRA